MIFFLRKIPISYLIQAKTNDVSPRNIQFFSVDYSGSSVKHEVKHNITPKSDKNEKKEQI